jgi:hypothetical protein
MNDKPDEIGDDYKLALGSLVVEASKLDSHLTEIIAAMTDMHLGHALIIVHHQQHSNKLDALRALFRMIYKDEDDPNYQPIKEMLGNIQRVADFRNSTVHALWHVDESGMRHTVRFQARGKLTRSRVAVPLEQIRQYTREAIDLAGSLSTLAKAYRGFPKTESQS